MTQRINTHGLQVDSDLYAYITHSAIPGTGVDADSFWAEFSAIVDDPVSYTHLTLPTKA